MYALHDEIVFLRLELANNPCPRERAQIAAELAAVGEHGKLSRGEH